MEYLNDLGSFGLRHYSCINVVCNILGESLEVLLDRQLVHCGLSVKKLDALQTECI